MSWYLVAGNEEGQEEPQSQYPVPMPGITEYEAGVSGTQRRCSVLVIESYEGYHGDGSAFPRLR